MNILNDFDDTLEDLEFDFINEDGDLIFIDKNSRYYNTLVSFVKIFGHPSKWTCVEFYTFTCEIKIYDYNNREFTEEEKEKVVTKLRNVIRQMQGKV